MCYTALIVDALSFQRCPGLCVGLVIIEEAQEKDIINTKLPTPKEIKSILDEYVINQKDAKNMQQNSKLSQEIYHRVEEIKIIFNAIEKMWDGIDLNIIYHIANFTYDVQNLNKCLAENLLQNVQQNVHDTSCMLF